jgi:hypothetical protein
MPDLIALQPLLDLSRRGVKFSQDVAKQVKVLFEEINSADATSRFIALIKMLQIMLEDKSAILLYKDVK